VDLVDEGVDLALRIGTLGPQGLVARRVGWTQTVCCASPAYLAAHAGKPLRTPHDLAGHECLSYTNVGMPNVWRFEPRDGGEPIDVRIDARHRANNGQLLASLAVSGLGIVYSPDFIVANEVRAGQLVPLFMDDRAPRLPIAAVYPSRRHLSAKVRAVVEFLAGRFERGQPWNLTLEQPAPGGEPTS
jgi:DNA-binding transcriptional LysR family regulator